MTGPERPRGRLFTQGTRHVCYVCDSKRIESKMFKIIGNSALLKHSHLLKHAKGCLWACRAGCFEIAKNKILKAQHGDGLFQVVFMETRFKQQLELWNEVIK